MNAPFVHKAGKLSHSIHIGRQHEIGQMHFQMHGLFRLPHLLKHADSLLHT